MSKIGVVIGRFQVPELTEAHKALLVEVVKESDQTIVLVGQSPGPLNCNNPLPFSIRHDILSTFFYLANKPVYILPLKDKRYHDVWAKDVDNIIDSLRGPKDQITLYGGRDSCVEIYKNNGGKYETKKMPSQLNISGTNTRNVIINSIPSKDDANGIIYALGNIPPRIYHAVDIAVIKGPCLLLARKDGEKNWRLPGGFVDIKDKNFEQAARRELYEETELTIEGRLTQIWQGNNNDWRTNDCEDVVTMTTLFVADYSFGIPNARDDIVEAKWFTIEEMPAIVDEHLPLIEALRDFSKI